MSRSSSHTASTSISRKRRAAIMMGESASESAPATSMVPSQSSLAMSNSDPAKPFSTGNCGIQSGSHAGSQRSKQNFSNATTCPHDCLVSVFAFCRLSEIGLLATVSRSWRSAAMRMPVLQMGRLATRMSESQMNEAVAALTRHQMLRSANGSKKLKEIKRLRTALRQLKCGPLGATLVTIVESAELTRKVVNKVGLDAYVMAILRLRVPSTDQRVHLPPAVAAASASTQGQLIEEIQLKIEYENVYDEEEEAADVWRIQWRGSSKHDTWQTLLRIDESPGMGYGMGSRFRSRSLVEWLRHRAVVGGDPREQFVLLSQFVGTLFRLVDDSSGIEDLLNSNQVSEACAKAVRFERSGAKNRPWQYQWIDPRSVQMAIELRSEMEAAAAQRSNLSHGSNGGDAGAAALSHPMHISDESNSDPSDDDIDDEIDDDVDDDVDDGEDPW